MVLTLREILMCGTHFEMEILMCGTHFSMEILMCGTHFEMEMWGKAKGYFVVFCGMP